MLVCDFLDHGQAQAGASHLGRDVGLEGPLKDVGGEARAAVTDAQAHAARGLVPARLYGHGAGGLAAFLDRKSTRLNSSHSQISYAVFCLKKKKNTYKRLPN